MSCVRLMVLTMSCVAHNVCTCSAGTALCEDLISGRIFLQICQGRENVNSAKRARSIKGTVSIVSEVEPAKKLFGPVSHSPHALAGPLWIQLDAGAHILVLKAKLKTNTNTKETETSTWYIFDS